MKIQVIRGEGNIKRSDIISALVSELQVALALGRVEMDIGANLLPVTQQVIYDANALVGNVTESFDRLNGTAWRGIVTSVQHGLNENGLVTELEMLRESR